MVAVTNTPMLHSTVVAALQPSIAPDGYDGMEGVSDVEVLFFVWQDTQDCDTNRSAGSFIVLAALGSLARMLS